MLIGMIGGIFIITVIFIIVKLPQFFDTSVSETYIDIGEYSYGGKDCNGFENFKAEYITNNYEKPVDVTVNLTYRNENYNYVSDENVTVRAIAPGQTAFITRDFRFKNEEQYFMCKIEKVKISKYNPVLLNENFFVDMEYDEYGDVTYTLKNECGKDTENCFIYTIYSTNSEVKDIVTVNAFDGEVPDGKRVNAYANTTLSPEEFDNISSYLYAYY